MPLKLKKSQTLSEPSSVKDELSGPWGRINPESQTTSVLRLRKTSSPSIGETHSYPYRVLSSWRWSRGIGEEELKIEAGPDLVIVKGRGLDRLVDALDQGRLEILSVTSGAHATESNEAVSIVSIIVTSHP
jgi:hypothetical protein